jgi:hypothetical protein
MITIPELQTALLDLLYRLNNTNVKPIIGGGFGIYLKRQYILRTGERTLLSEIPEPRSTKDIDLFLRPELLINTVELMPLKTALDDLEYKAKKGAENYQFIKPGPNGAKEGEIIIDLLTGPESSFEGTPVKVDERRARPQPSINLHAHPTNEAQTLEEKPKEIPFSGKLSNGMLYQTKVLLPHPYTFLMMKLYAFRDKSDRKQRKLATYHALDLYTIIATTTEEEWRYALILRDRLQYNPDIKEACNIVSNYFTRLNSLGMLRLRESEYSRDNLQFNDFMSILQELFPSITT